MRDIANRARKYAEFIEKERHDAYIFTDVDILVEEAYEQGARDEWLFLTTWRNPSIDLPEHTGVVLIKLEEHYVVCLWRSDIKMFLQPNGYRYSPDGIDAWRPICDFCHIKYEP